MLWWSVERLVARSSRVVAGAVLVFAAACGGTSRESHDSTGGHAGMATAGGGSSGAAGRAAAGHGGVAGLPSAGRGGSGMGGSSGDAGQGGDGAQSGTSGAAGRGGSGAGRGGSGAGRGGAGKGGAAGAAGGGKAGNATGGAGMSGGQGGMVPLGALEPAVKAYCGAVSTCCGGSVPLDGCESSYATQSINLASLAAGLVTVDPGALSKCQAAYAGTDPCNLNAVVAACQGLFVGTRAVNESCTQGYDCDRSQGEMTCVIAGDCNDDPMGVCTKVPHAKLNETCLSSCYAGSDCSSTTCGVADTNALCFEDDGLYCEYFDSGSICKALVPVGSPCSSSASQECGSNAYCDVTCKARSKLGEDCGYGCRHELQCGPDQKCMDPVWSDEYSCMGYPPGL